MPNLNVDGIRALRERIGQGFAYWEEFVPPGMVELTTNALTHLLDQLLGLGPRAEVANMLPIFEEFIKRMNASNEQNGVWIETGERDDIGMIIREIAALADLKGVYELEDGTIWRDY